MQAVHQDGAYLVAGLDRSPNRGTLKLPGDTDPVRFGAAPGGHLPRRKGLGTQRGGIGAGGCH